MQLMVEFNLPLIVLIQIYCSKLVYKLLLHITKVLSKFISVYKANEYLLYVLRDLCLHRLWKSNPKVNKKRPKFIMVKYVNRLLDQVNVGKIIHSNQSFKIFPGSREHLINTGVTFKYTNTIRSKVTNYKATVTKDNGNVLCACKDYQEFVDDHFGHIITGNLNIIKNEDVKRLFIKGLNFREKQPLNVDKAYASIQSAIDSYINTISNALKIPIHLFSPWKSFVLNKAKTRLYQSHKHPVITTLDKTKNKNI